MEEGYSVEVPSCRGSSQRIVGYVDNRSGFGEEDDSNAREVEERDGEEVLSVACNKGVNHDVWMKECLFRRTTRP